MKALIFIVMVLVLILIHTPFLHAEPDSSPATIAGEVQGSQSDTRNPFQHNSNFTLGRFGAAQNILSLQPMMPFSGNGPSRSLPIGTINSLKTERWGAGPAGAVVYSLRAWVGGVQINRIWSFPGDADQDATHFQVQPFLNYNLSKGWYLTSSSPINSYWSNGGRNMWTVPVGGGFGKVMSVYGQTINIGAQGHVYPIRPGDAHGPDWTIQTTLQWLFPK